MTACYRTTAGAAVLWLVTSTGNAQDKLTRYVRYTYEARQAYGILEDETIYELEGVPFDAPKLSGKQLMSSAVTLLPPCEPSKIVAAGFIYQDHEEDEPRPGFDPPFQLWGPRLLSPGDPIELRGHESTRLHVEGRLAIIIAKKAEQVTIAEASHYIFGVTPGCDVSAVTFQRSNLTWSLKNIYRSIGPTIVKGLDYQNLQIETRIDGQLRYREHSNDLIFDPLTAVSYVSRHVTLLPGDAILTGFAKTPEILVPGTVIEIAIEGAGALRHQVVSAIE